MYLVEGHPLVYYSINAALNAKNIDKVFVSTDNKEISGIADGCSCEVISRPEETEKKGFAGVVVYTIKKISEKYGDCRNFIILSGNTAMISSYLIEKSLEVLDKRKDAKSVMTVWKSRHDHPRYALALNDNKFLKHFLEKEPQEEIYFFDGTVCAIRKEIINDDCFKDESWWANLPDCLPLVRPWPTGRDVHDSYDLGLARWWLQNSPIDIVEEVK
jgi:CMP-2-keto-3-deoxyoctulosonic acid synthetase